jgi:hypothetical protein
MLIITIPIQLHSVNLNLRPEIRRRRSSSLKS